MLGDLFERWGWVLGGSIWFNGRNSSTVTCGWLMVGGLFEGQKLGKMNMRRSGFRISGRCMVC